MVRHDLLEATVLSGGPEPLVEYEDPEDQKTQTRLRMMKKLRGEAVVRYIEAQARAECVVEFKLHPGYVFRKCNALSVRLYADGEYIDGVLVQKRTGAQAGFSHQIRGRDFKGKNNKWQTQSLHFGDLSVIDRDRPCDEAEFETWAEAGMLRVGVYQVKVKRVVKAAKSTANQSTEQDVPEEALKGRAADLKTEFADASPTGARRTRRTEQVDPLPLVTFVFKYQSREGLYRDHVIERTPSSPAAMHDVHAVIKDEPMELLQTQGDGELHSQDAKLGNGAQAVSRQSNASDEKDDIQSSEATAATYLRQTFRKIRRDIEAFGSEPGMAPKKLIKHKAAIRRKIETLQDEVLCDDSDDERRGGRGDQGQTQSYLSHTLRKVLRDVDDFDIDQMIDNKKLEKQKAAVMRKFDTLQDEVFKDESDDEKSGSWVKKETPAVVRKSNAATFGRNLLEISDDDD